MSDEVPAAVYVLGVARAVDRGDWMLARWSARMAVLARVSALLDDGHEVDTAKLPPAPEGRMVGAERGE